MSETSQASSENEKKKRPRGPRRRQVHNAVERRRKDKINNWICKISELLPCQEVFKLSKISILEQTVDYIKLLQTEREKLLSESLSEVQAEEIRKLKRDLKIVHEQNTVYEYLLKEAKISTRGLPSKILKYSSKFSEDSNISITSNVESTVNKNSVSDVPNSSLLNTSDANSSNSIVNNTVTNVLNTSLNGDVSDCNTLPRNSLDVKSSSSIEPQKRLLPSASKVAKTPLKPQQNLKKQTTDVISASTSVQSYVPINVLTSNQSFAMSPFSIATIASNLSQGNVTAVVNCGNFTKNVTSLDSCGVTSVLSPFPVMSTSQGSSISNICNRTMPTIIIPTGSSILQPIPTPEKVSSTISILCPTTLPILVPQQVFNMSSMTKTVNLSSTLLCSGPVANTCMPYEKPVLSNTLLTLNPSSVVSITSAVPDNTKVILPSSQFEVACDSDNAITPVITSSQVLNNQIMVSLVQKSHATPTSFSTAVHSSNNILIPESSISFTNSNVGITKSQDSIKTSISATAVNTTSPITAANPYTDNDSITAQNPIRLPCGNVITTKNQESIMVPNVSVTVNSSLPAIIHSSIGTSVSKSSKSLMSKNVGFTSNEIMDASNSNTTSGSILSSKVAYSSKDKKISMSQKFINPSNGSELSTNRQQRIITSSNVAVNTTLPNKIAYSNQGNITTLGQASKTPTNKHIGEIKSHGNSIGSNNNNTVDSTLADKGLTTNYSIITTSGQSFTCQTNDDLKGQGDVSLLNNNATICSVSPSKDVNISTKYSDATKKLRRQNSPKKQEHYKQMPKFTANLPPSLQVLSANKIISLANQSQKIKTSLVLPVNEKASLKTTSVSLQPNNTECNKPSNNFCIQIDTPGIRDNFKLSTENSATDEGSSSITPNKISSIKTLETVVTPTNFSLTALMGESHSIVKETSCNSQSKVTPNSHPSKDCSNKTKNFESTTVKAVTNQSVSDFKGNISVVSNVEHYSKTPLLDNRDNEDIGNKCMVIPLKPTLSNNSIDNAMSCSKQDMHIVPKSTIQSISTVASISPCTDVLTSDTTTEISPSSVSFFTLTASSSVPVTSGFNNTSFTCNSKLITAANADETSISSSTMNMNNTSTSNALKNSQFLQSGIVVPSPSFNSAILSISEENVNTSLSENILSSGESNMNQHALITISDNQSASTNHHSYMTHPSSNNSFSSPSVLPNNPIKYITNAGMPSSNQIITSYPNAPYYSYATEQSKQVVSESNSMTKMMTSVQEIPFTHNESIDKRNSAPPTINLSGKFNTQSGGVSDNNKHQLQQQVSNFLPDYAKHPPKKKIKPLQKNCKLVQNNSNNVCFESSASNNFSNSSTNNSPGLTSKVITSSVDATSCTRLESSNYVFTSDILARATESIFGSDMLENSQSKKVLSHYSEDSMNINSMLASSGSKSTEISCKLQSLNTNKEIDENCQEHSMSTSTKDKKNLNFNDAQSMNLLNSSKGESPLHNANQNLVVHGVNSLNSANDISTSNRNIQEISKPSKSCKVRKSKTNPENEPPTKKPKEISLINEKIDHQNFEQPLASSKEHEKRVFTDVQLPMQCVDKDSHHTFINDQGNIETMPLTNNLMQENSCKTPTSVDNVFSLTPMLGDILKDVPHGIGIDGRSNFLGCNDNQSIYLSDKNNFISFNYGSNTNEDYLNLPRMYFPIVPEIPPAPTIQATNVSFAHSVSLCSTQSDTSKSTGTVSTESQNKFNSKKKVQASHAHHNPASANQDLSASENVMKGSDCVPKSVSVSQFGTVLPKLSENSPSLVDQSIDRQNSSSSTGHVSHSVSSHLNSNFSSRETYAQPAVPHSINFYNPPSSVTNVQQNVVSNSSSMLPQSYNCSNSSGMSYSVQSTNPGTNSFNSSVPFSKADSLSHSLCSLLKENNNILNDNRAASTAALSQSISTAVSTNTSQSKYSALSLISDQSFSEPSLSSGCHSDYVQTTINGTAASSSHLFVATSSTCSRNPRTSLSYSAESLLQTSCATSEKSKNKNIANNRYQQRLIDKKERDNSSNLHNITDTNIFMPVSNCDISIQNAPLVPLPPVTSFHNFSSNYTMCETVPSTTLFNSVSRAHDIPSLANENFLSHSLNVESQMLNTRHLNSDSAVPKPHSNLSLPFENHGPLYNNCNFLQHSKPNLDNTRASDPNGCFQTSTFNNSYSQQSQKANCCHFTHRTISTNSDLPTEISLAVAPPVPSFHTDKNNLHGNRASLQPNFSQSNSNFVGNFFYNSNVRDGNVATKPSNARISQEVSVNDGTRQNIHDHNNSVVFSNRKNISSNRTKSKKVKNVSVNESNINLVPNSIANFCTNQESPCNKSNSSYIPNGYFKNNPQSIIPPPSHLQCVQNKIPEKIVNPVIPPNSSFNSTLHQQGDYFNLNLQPPNLAMNPLPRPPTQPLSCTCLTAPIITHTFASATHPVPNFNLSNILPDMGCSSNSVSLSPAKFPPGNHSMQSSVAQCQSDANLSNTAHIVSHQSCAPSLYPPHPSMVRGNLNPILGHNSQSANESQLPLVGNGNPISHQNASIVSSQNPTFRNVIHPLNFPRSDH